MFALSPARSSYALLVHAGVLAWSLVAACVIGGVWVALPAASSEWPILGPVIVFICALLVAGGVIAARMGSRWPAAAPVAVGALVIGTPFFRTVPASTRRSPSSCSSPSMPAAARPSPPDRSRATAGLRDRREADPQETLLLARPARAGL